jgi:hypothetical protein
MVIQQRASKLDSLKALYGMGSYFSSDQFHDIDFVAVVDCPPAHLTEVGRRIRFFLGELRAEFHAPIDVTIFTSSEFGRKPLRDFSTLVPLYSRDV